MNKLLSRLLIGAGLISTSAMAQAVDPDYSVITAAVSVAGLSVAIIGMAALKAGPNVARWAGNKLANFFR